MTERTYDAIRSDGSYLLGWAPRTDAAARLIPRAEWAAARS